MMIKVFFFGEGVSVLYVVVFDKEDEKGRLVVVVKLLLIYGLCVLMLVGVNVNERMVR